MKGFTKRGEVDLIAGFLTVHHTAFINIKSNQRDVSHTRVSFNSLQDADKCISVAALQCRGNRVLRGKINQKLYI